MAVPHVRIDDDVASVASTGTSASYDPFAATAQQHAVFRNAAKDCADKLMLVVLDEEMPHPTVARAANILRVSLRRFAPGSRSALEVFALFAFRARDVLRHHRALRRALLTYIARRRGRIDKCVTAWQEAEVRAQATVGFLEFVALYVPQDMKRRAVVAHHLACCHACQKGWKVFRQKRAAATRNTFARAFAIRSVSSRAFRAVRTVVEACVDVGAPVFAFTRTAILHLVTAHIRMVCFPAVMARADAAFLERIPDAVLRIMSQQPEDENATERERAGFDAAVSLCDAMDGSLIEHWLLTRLQHHDDLPMDAFSNENLKLRAVVSEPIVSPEVLRVADGMLDLIALFKAAFDTRRALQDAARRSAGDNKGALRRAASRATRRGSSLSPSSPRRQVKSKLAEVLMAREKQREDVAARERERLLAVAIDAATAESFERPLCLVGDGWMEEDVWRSDLVATSKPVGAPTDLQQLRRDTRRANRASSARSHAMTLAVRRQAMQEQRATTRLHETWAAESRGSSRAASPAQAGVPQNFPTPPSKSAAKSTTPRQPSPVAASAGGQGSRTPRCGSVVPFLPASPPPDRGPTPRAQRPKPRPGSRLVGEAGPPLAIGGIVLAHRGATKNDNAGYAMLKSFLAAPVPPPSLAVGPVLDRRRVRRMRHIGTFAPGRRSPATDDAATGGAARGSPGLDLSSSAFGSLLATA